MKSSPYRLRIWTITFAICVALSCCAFANAQSAIKQTVGSLGEGTTWETRWFVIESGVPGPTVLIVGGIHGNEPAGFRAAEQIKHWPIKRGKLVVVPQVNRLGMAANMRWSPDHRNDRKKRDLNRNFPTKSRPQPQTEHCRAIWGVRHPPSTRLGF